VESVEDGLKVMERGSWECDWRRIRVRKRMGNGGSHRIFTVFRMPCDRASVENAGSIFKLMVWSVK
jgi:hypothetical protein